MDRVCDLPHSVISKIAETEFEVKVLATQNDRLSSQAIRLEQLLKQKQNTLQLIKSIYEGKLVFESDDLNN